MEQPPLFIEWLPFRIQAPENIQNLSKNFVAKHHPTFLVDPLHQESANEDADQMNNIPVKHQAMFRGTLMTSINQKLPKNTQIYKYNCKNTSTVSINPRQINNSESQENNNMTNIHLEKLDNATIRLWNPGMNELKTDLTTPCWSSFGDTVWQSLHMCVQDSPNDEEQDDDEKIV